MKTFKKVAMSATIIAGIGAGLAHADTFQALLSVVSPIALNETTQMQIGEIQPTANAQTCQISNAAGVRVGAACFGTAAGTAAILDVSGTTGNTFDISLANGTVDGMTFSPEIIDNGEGATTVLGVNLTPSHQLTVGGTLTIDDFTLAELSTASSISYDVTVTYQ
jgi:hypothetical protein